MNPQVDLFTDHDERLDVGSRLTARGAELVVAYGTTLQREDGMGSDEDR